MKKDYQQDLLQAVSTIKWIHSEYEWDQLLDLNQSILEKHKYFVLGSKNDEKAVYKFNGKSLELVPFSIIQPKNKQKLYSLTKVSSYPIKFKSIEQLCFTDALLDPSIDCISSDAILGAGKTLLSLVAAFYQIASSSTCPLFS